MKTSHVAVSDITHEIRDVRLFVDSEKRTRRWEAMNHITKTTPLMVMTPQKTVFCGISSRKPRNEDFLYWWLNCRWGYGLRFRRLRVVEKNRREEDFCFKIWCNREGCGFWNGRADDDSGNKCLECNRRVRRGDAMDLQRLRRMVDACQYILPEVVWGCWVSLARLPNATSTETQPCRIICFYYLQQIHRCTRWLTTLQSQYRVLHRLCLQTCQTGLHLLLLVHWQRFLERRVQRIRPQVVQYEWEEGKIDMWFRW